MQNRSPTAADFLETALDRGWNLCRIGDLLAIGAERLADLGEVHIDRKRGLELILGLRLAVRVDPQRRFLHRRPAAVVEHDGENRQLVLFGYSENRVADVEVEAAVAHDLDRHVLGPYELGAERHAAGGAEPAATDTHDSAGNGTRDLLLHRRRVAGRFAEDDVLRRDPLAELAAEIVRVDRSRL